VISPSKVIFFDLRDVISPSEAIFFDPSDVISPSKVIFFDLRDVISPSKPKNNEPQGVGPTRAAFFDGPARRKK
jgi:hypothetical protein